MVQHGQRCSYVNWTLVRPSVQSRFCYWTLGCIIHQALIPYAGSTCLLCARLSLHAEVANGSVRYNCGC